MGHAFVVKRFVVPERKDLGEYGRSGHGRYESGPSWRKDAERTQNGAHIANSVIVVPSVCQKITSTRFPDSSVQRFEKTFGEQDGWTDLGPFLISGPAFPPSKHWPLLARDERAPNVQQLT
jgi:hypothetical protein